METNLNDKVLHALNQMGSDVHEVAAFLEGQGIRGSRLLMTHCPISKYLQRLTGQKVMACTQSIYSYRLLSAEESKLFHINTPPVIKEFIVAFDEGSFPQLDL